MKVDDNPITSLVNKSLNDTSRKDYKRYNKKCRDENKNPILVYIDEKLKGKQHV